MWLCSEFVGILLISALGLAVTGIPEADHFLRSAIVRVMSVTLAMIEDKHCNKTLHCS